MMTEISPEAGPAKQVAYLPWMSLIFLQETASFGISMQWSRRFSEPVTRLMEILQRKSLVMRLKKQKTVIKRNAEIESELGRVSGKLAALAMVFQNGYEDIWFHQGEILPGHVRESKENPGYVRLILNNKLLLYEKDRSRNLRSFFIF